MVQFQKVLSDLFNIFAECTPAAAVEEPATVCDADAGSPTPSLTCCTFSLGRVALI